jgi:hypothetical protein
MRVASMVPEILAATIQFGFGFGYERNTQLEYFWGAFTFKKNICLFESRAKA